MQSEIYLGQISGPFHLANFLNKKLIITDTIDNSDRVKGGKNIEILTISQLVGEAIKRISNSTSVSDLFT